MPAARGARFDAVNLTQLPALYACGPRCPIGRSNEAAQLLVLSQLKFAEEERIGISPSQLPLSSTAFFSLSSIGEFRPIHLFPFAVLCVLTEDVDLGTELWAQLCREQSAKVNALLLNRRTFVPPVSAFGANTSQLEINEGFLVSDSTDT